MKVATYNVNGVNGRLDLLLRWLEEASPDVVALQELKAPQEEFPVKAIDAAGYSAVWQGQKFSPRRRKAEVDRQVRGWEHTSDHAPVWIELEMRTYPEEGFVVAGVRHF